MSMDTSLIQYWKSQNRMLWRHETEKCLREYNVSIKVTKWPGGVAWLRFLYKENSRLCREFSFYNKNGRRYVVRSILCRL